jgi:hypothetical protein
LAVVAGVGTIVLLTSSVEVSRGVIVLQCGDALAPKTGAEVDVQTIQAAGAILVHPCDDPIRQRRLVSALVGVATIAALTWLGLEIRRSQNDEPLTA